MQWRSWVHLPGAAFVNPNTPLRDALTEAATRRALQITALGNEYTPLGKVVDERAIVNGIVGLLATGGSTNHTIHLVAMARAAGVLIDWDDFNDLSAVVPLLAKIYPNGEADVNHFHAAGGWAPPPTARRGACAIRTCCGCPPAAALRRRAVPGGRRRRHWRRAPSRERGRKCCAALPSRSRPTAASSSAGNLGAGRKVSAVQREHRVIEAPAIVFNDQAELMAAFAAAARARLRSCDIRAPRQRQPELQSHAAARRIGTRLGALVTDGRMSGAGRVPAAIT
jgi:phosphogluconate dehydratase